MTWLTAIILGALEGFTEFLPISSTAHLTLAAQLLKLAETDFLKSFIIIIQLGAILAVVWLYRVTLFQKKNSELNKKVLAAFLPTAIIGFVLYKLIKTFLLGNTNIALWAMLLGGVIIIIFERWHKKRELNNTSKSANLENSVSLEDISYRQAVTIGLAQALAVVPGVSRSAATIIGGLALGLSRQTIVEFSFLLAIPTMLAATIYDFYKSAGAFSLAQFDLLLIGFVSAFIFALISVKFLLKYIQQHTFTAFGLYRIIVAVVFLFLF
ncbi:MAG: undecaprenyl-diphosphate phosphatase [Patescibacteria group bacterium]